MQRFIANIHSLMETLPKRQRNFCEYLLENYRSIPIMSVHQLAEASGTSATTILRVLQKLGYEYYKDFQSDTQQFLLMETSVVFSRFAQSDTDGETDPLAYVANSNCSDIQKNLNDINRDSFDKVVDLMVGARKIAFLGLRSSSFVAGYMHTVLSTFCDNCVLVQADGSEYLYERMQFLDDRDLLIAVSLGGPHYTSRTIDAVKYAKTRAIPVALITSSIKNPATASADHFFIAHPSRYISLTSALTIADALIFAFFNRKKMPLHDSDLAKTLIEHDVLLRGPV